MNDAAEVLGHVLEEVDYQRLLAIADRLCGGTDRERDYGNEMIVRLRRAEPISTTTTRSD